VKLPIILTFLPFCTTLPEDCFGWMRLNHDLALATEKSGSAFFSGGDT